MVGTHTLTDGGPYFIALVCGDPHSSVLDGGTHTLLHLILDGGGPYATILDGGDPYVIAAYLMVGAHNICYLVVWTHTLVYLTVGTPTQLYLMVWAYTQQYLMVGTHTQAYLMVGPIIYVAWW